MPARTFTNQEGTSNKFWTIEVDGASHTVHYGRLGTDGQVKTKAFADAAKAAASAEKLIAEKLRKGYAEQAAATPPPAASPRVAVTAPPVAAPAPPVAAGALRSGVELRPDEWAWASWRPLPDPPGPPEPFDPARAAAIIKSAKAPEWGYWSWREAPFTGALTPEAAYAWLRHTSEHRMTPTQSARAMATDPGVVPSTAEARRLASWTHLPPGFAFAALIDISGPEDVAEWLLADRLDQQYRYGDPRDTLALGVRAHLLPRLAPADRERFVDEVRSRFAKFSGWGPSQNDYSAPIQVLLAAQVGLHAELQALLDGWPDDAISREEWIEQSARPQAIAFGLGSPEAVREAFERLRLRIARGWHVAGWLAHTEISGLAFAADRIAAVTNRDDAEDAVHVLACVHDPAAAPAMLDLVRNSRAAALARGWLSDHPLEAAVGLARALEGRSRPETVDYLRARKRAGDDLAAALPHLSEGAAARLRELVLDHTERATRELTRDEVPAELRAAPTKKLPTWLDPAALPPVIVGDGRLGADDTVALLRLLAAGEPAPAGLDETDAFGWALFEAWLAEGAPSKDKWAMVALGTLGGDATAVKLAPLIRAWPGESQHARAVLGLGVLGQIGTDTALMLLSGIAEKVKFKALQQRAREAMDEIATAKGMSKAELEDRIVPTCGLDEQGSRTFDFGPRQFEFVLGPGMKPMVRDESGKVRSGPPKPGARDDEALAARATEDWKLLRKQVSDVARIQAARLEQAMVTQRRWSVEDFERFVVNHPLQRHLARLLVWRDATTTFRVTDELDYADADDEPVTIGGEIGIVHPLQLSADERAAWGEQLADYEIVPPFAQLGRPVLDVEDGDRRERELTRFARSKIGASTLVRLLENLGWQRGAAFDNGIFTLHAKPFPSLGVTAVVQYDGIPMGYMVDWEDQALERVYVLGEAVRSAHDLGWGAPHDVKAPAMLRWGDVDAIVRSEVLADVAAVLEKAR